MTEHRHSNAIIWLQEGEDEGAADCGCRLINDEDGARFLMCGKHETTSELFDALLDLVCCPAFSGQLFERDKESHKAWTLARAAIAKATGEDQ